MTLKLLLLMENSICALMELTTYALLQSRNCVDKFEKNDYVQQSNSKLYEFNRVTAVFGGRSLITSPPMMINMEVSAMRHCFKPKQPYPLVCILNFFERDICKKNSIFLQIFRLGQNFTIKYKTSCNLCSENLKQEFLADLKL